MRNFRNPVHKIEVSLKSDKDNGYCPVLPGTVLYCPVRDDLRAFFNIYRSILLIMRNTSDKIGREHQNTHFMFNNPNEDNDTYNAKKNTVQPDRPQLTIRRKPLQSGYLRLQTHTHNIQSNQNVSVHLMTVL